MKKRNKMKKKFQKIKRQFNEFIQDLKLKVLIVYLSIKSKRGTMKEYERLTRIRKSNLQYSIKKVMINKPLPSYFEQVKIFKPNTDELILKNEWNIKTERVKEILNYMDELRKPHVEATLHGYDGNSSPIFYVPEIVDIHNESLEDIKGPELNILIKQENDFAYNSLKRQKVKLDALQIKKPSTLDVNRLKPKLEKAKEVMIKVDKNETHESFFGRMKSEEERINSIDDNHG